mgnify:CR=1 FL=1
MTVDFVEVELGGDNWTITWDVSRRKKIKTTGEKSGYVEGCNQFKLKQNIEVRWGDPTVDME